MGHYEDAPLSLKKSQFHMPDGSILNGPKQALGSLYKEFLIDNMVYRFYLHQANKEAFVYKFIGKRKPDGDDKKLKTLLREV